MKWRLKSVLLCLVLGQSVQAQSVEYGGAQKMMPPITIDPRCQMSVSSPEIDFGEMSAGQLQELPGGRKLSPGKRTLTLSVSCPFSQPMRLMLRGERATNGEVRYGSKGSVELRMLDAQLDGQTIGLAIESDDRRRHRAGRPDVVLKPGDEVIAVRDGQPARGKNFSARIDVEPVLPERATRVPARETSTAMMVLELIE